MCSDILDIGEEVTWKEPKEYPEIAPTLKHFIKSHGRGPFVTAAILNWGVTQEVILRDVPTGLLLMYRRKVDRQLEVRVFSSTYLQKAPPFI